MLESNLADALSRLTPLAEQLNDESDALNATLEGVERRLAVLNVGLTVWLDKPLLREGEAPGRDNWGSTLRWSEVRIGFAKIRGSWKLAVKRVSFEAGFYEGDSDCAYQQSHDDGTPQALLEATRDVRVAALQQLPALVTEIADRAKEAIAAIQTASHSLR